VVDGNLNVYGVENLRLVDGSIMPRVTTGNTVAPSFVIGERAAIILKTKYELYPLADSVGASSLGTALPMQWPSSCEG
jgi:choline dehydrogenase-like flavoprotein